MSAQKEIRVNFCDMKRVLGEETTVAVGLTPGLMLPWVAPPVSHTALVRPGVLL